MSAVNQPPPAPAPQAGHAARSAPQPGPGPGPAPRRRSRPGDGPSWPAKARPVVDIAARILCLLLGGALVVAGVVGLFTDVGEIPLITVLAAGLLLLITPSIVDRIRRLKPGAFEVELLRQIAESARKTAESLRRLGMEPELDAYATIYTELNSPELKAVRGQVLDRIVQRVSQAAAVEKFDREEVKDLFLHGSPVVRVLALGLMEGDLSLIDSEVLLDAVNRSLTGNEQFHALRIVRNGWGRLTPAERNQLLAAIASNPQIERSPDRRAVAEAIGELAGTSITWPRPATRNPGAR